MSANGPTEAEADRSRRPRADAGASIDPGFPIVGVGASAGGLDPFKRLIEAVPAGSGMAFILVQHLDPDHESMMVDLLTGHTTMTVETAAEGQAIEPDHLYVLAPGTYVSVSDDRFRLARPPEAHGMRLPFDHLLRSMAATCGARSIGVVLSGGGTDGSLGLVALKDRGGCVIVQDPDEAGYDGMPRSAIATGVVDMVLAVADMPGALAGYRKRMTFAPKRLGAAGPPSTGDQLPQILDLLRSRTDQDFRLYKHGTLERRIERRMAMGGIGTGDLQRYIGVLRRDARELDLLAKDLLIHVTSFFRNPDVFERLSDTIIPDLIRDLAPDRPLRIWIAGCSTGEETYSLAILFHEQILAADRDVRLQIFASDVDPDAIASARAGFYPETIASDVSPARLARFFAREGDGYRVLPELRASVVFTVQDVLADPPFSRIDMVSCRNLLIYLSPDAQRKVIALFHFAIRDNGILLLGNAETIGKPDGRFEVIAEQERLYRHAGRTRSPDVALTMRGGDPHKGGMQAGPGLEPSRQAAFADLCRSLLMETYAPAAVLADRRNVCLYLVGRTDDYLMAAAGHAVHDVLAMAREGVRTKLRSAIQRAWSENARVVVTGGRMVREGETRAFSVAVQPIRHGPEELVLICFLDEPKRLAAARQGNARYADDLERELEAMRAELETTIRSHEAFGEEQKAVNEEALSVNEEYQSTNEELISSKEELQSLNEELSALNGQLQETLERQRTTANDLQNVLYSTDVATLFLDVDQKIRFFTPAVRALFSVIPSDVGRPLSDFHSLAADAFLPADAKAVLASLTSIEREIEAPNGTWFSRRIMPYRTHGDGVEGVVITFADVTERKLAAKALEDAKQLAERANAAKSRFLAAASHDLRQPLQTLTLLQSLLVKAAEGDATHGLLARSEEALSAMSDMLDTLLDINQIEAGAVRAAIVDFPIGGLLDRLRAEFVLLAAAQGLVLRVVPCGASIATDPRLLEQMLRNLLSNALKYTKRGKILIGCRRRGGQLGIEIWDTGLGIPADALETIFEEYHQIDNAARDRRQGLGLGLSIVQRLGSLLGHRVHVRSTVGKGSVFAVDAALASTRRPSKTAHLPDATARGANPSRACSVLIVEDDAAVRDLLELTLDSEGHRTATAPDGPAALDLVARRVIQPDIILADYNLPGGMDGLQVAAALRLKFRRPIPVIILTGDIATGTSRAIVGHGCVPLNKPIKPATLSRAIQDLLPASPRSRDRPPPRDGDGAMPMIFVIDDDDAVRAAIRSVLEDDGRRVEDHASCEMFLAALRPDQEGCVLVDAYLPGMSGIELLDTLRLAGRRLPSIMITGNSDVQTAVRAMKAGASDFIEKPVGGIELLAGIERALRQARDFGKLAAWRRTAAARVADLTDRQREVMALVLAGQPSKNIAADLGISQRTVENHRATIMRKTGAKSLPALARLSFAAAWTPGDEAA